MDIRVRYHVPDKMLPQFEIKAYEKGDWFDLRCSEDTECILGATYSIPLGVSIELPENMEAYICPRSSLLMRTGLVGLFSVIDNSYRGDDDIWHLQVYATRRILIHCGERIAQFRIMPKMLRDITFQTVKFLGNENRGGLGTTGHV